MRFETYYNINTKLSYLSNNDIKTLFEKVTQEGETTSWCENKIIEIDSIKIFCKKIPVAELFANQQFETKNLYNLPMHYNYGIGSAGFSPWRELLLHIKITNFVLNGEMDNFPLLYHYRIIEEIEEKKQKRDITEDIERWNNDKNIKKYLEDRNDAKMKIIMFFEYIKYNSSEALKLKKISYSNALSQGLSIVNFLNKNKILHMDSHPFNYLVDEDGKLYLADFGISLDEKFNLSKEEKKFMKNNSTYDYSLTLSLLSFSRDEYQIIKQNGYNKKNFFANLDVMKDLLNIDNDRYKKLVENKDIMDMFDKFRWNLIDSPNKSEIVYPNKEIKNLIFIPQLGGNYKQKFIKYRNKGKMIIR